MKKVITSNLNLRLSLRIEPIESEGVILRYFVKLIDSEQDDDKMNPLWIIEPIGEGTYQLTYEQLVVRGLVMFGSLSECLNYIKDECFKSAKYKAL